MPGMRVRVAWLTEAASALYIGVIALVAQSTGLFYVLFPELGALGHDIRRSSERSLCAFHRRSLWASCPS